MIPSMGVATVNLFLIFLCDCDVDIFEPEQKSLENFFVTKKSYKHTYGCTYKEVTPIFTGRMFPIEKQSYTFPVADPGFPVGGANLVGGGTNSRGG